MISKLETAQAALDEAHWALFQLIATKTADREVRIELLRALQALKGAWMKAAHCATVEAAIECAAVEAAAEREIARQQAELREGLKKR